MANDQNLSGGVIAILLSLLFFYFSRRTRYSIKLAMRTPVTAVAAVQEGMVQVVGRAVGAASEKSHMLGLNCLITHTKIEACYKNQDKKKWRTEWDAKKSVPFFVEDESGRIYVDPGKAEFELDPDVEMTIGRWWRRAERPKPAVAALQWTAEGLEARLRDLYFDILVMKYGPNSLPEWMKRAAMAGHKKLNQALDDPVFHQQALAEGYVEPATSEQREKLEDLYKRGYQGVRHTRDTQLRISEQNLLPGDKVYVLGPAFNSPEGKNWAYPIMIRKEHPSDTFIVGEGTPGEVHGRIRKKSREQFWIGVAFLAAGLLLFYTYYSEGGS